MQPVPNTDSEDSSMCQPGTVVFVYGTLMAPEVLQVLIKRVPRSQPGGQPMQACMQATCLAGLYSLEEGTARVQGYFRHRIKGHIFPGVQPAKPQDEVNGLVRLTCSTLTSCTAVYTWQVVPEKTCSVLKHLHCAMSGACTGVCKRTCSTRTIQPVWLPQYCGAAGAARPQRQRAGGI